MNIITSKWQREIESLAVKNNIELITLMRMAGKAVFDNVIAKFNNKKNYKVSILCGSGGNGGDGFVAGMHFFKSNVDVDIIICNKEPSKCDSLTVYNEAKKLGLNIIFYNSQKELVLNKTSKADVIIDACYGIGFHGCFSNELSVLFNSVNNNKNAYKLAVDVPSGVNCDTASVCENAFIADVTLTMIGLKPANILKRSLYNVGESIVYKMNIPEVLYEDYSSINTIEIEDIKKIMPQRESVSHKGTFGKLLIIAGCDRYRGAAILATKGALNSGVGLISVASTEKVLNAVSNTHPEPILIDTVNDIEYFEENLKNYTTCLIGPGLSLSTHSHYLFDIVLKKSNCPLIIDADALNILSENIEILKNTNRNIVLTPHLGEFARLTNKTINEIIDNKIELAKQFAKEYNVVLVLKSENTIIASPTGEIYICTLGNSGMAKGGSGDLLSGIIASFTSLTCNAFYGAILGVYIHSYAGDLAKNDLTEFCVTPTAISNYIPNVIFIANTL